MRLKTVFLSCCLISTAALVIFQVSTYWSSNQSLLFLKYNGIKSAVNGGNSTNSTVLKTNSSDVSKSGGKANRTKIKPKATTARQLVPKIILLPDFGQIKAIYETMWEFSYKKDYYRLNYDGEHRLVLKSLFVYNPTMNAYQVRDFAEFQKHWKRSRFIQCKDFQMIRKETPHILNLEAVKKNMTSIRDIFLENSMVPFLSFGTLLGWFRECTIIPHTKHIDFGVRGEEYSPSFLEKFKYDGISIERSTGMPNDSMEITFSVSSSSSPLLIDVTLLYKEDTHTWSGKTEQDGSKYKYNQPNLGKLCTADLFDRLFWIPCNIEEFLRGRYGKYWMHDVPTKDYVEKADIAKSNGKFSSEELKKMKF